MTPRLRKLIAVALLLVAIAIPYQLVIRPVIALHRDYDERIADSHELIRQFRRSAADLEALRAHAENLARQPALQSGYLSGDSEALAAAQLQNLAKVTIEAAGGVLNSTQVLPAQPVGGVRKVTARISMTGSIEAVFQAFYRLEAMEPMLFLDNVDVGSRTRRRSRNRNAEAEDNPQLNASFEVYGYMRGV